MLEIVAERWSLERDLQIIQAEVKLTVDGEVLVEEALCIDVGLPALLYGAFHDVEPNRWAAATEWQRMPFFVCGCGDPECRGFSFRVRHLDEQRLELTALEERQGDKPRAMERMVLETQAYRQEALRLGRMYLDFVAGLDYRPYFADTVPVVTELVERLEREAG